MTAAGDVTNFDLLSDMLSANSLTGTLLRQNATMQLWWSHVNYNDAPTAFEQDRSEWLCLGDEGWYPNNELKAAYAKVKQLAGDLFPQYPGEYVDLDHAANDKYLAERKATYELLKAVGLWRWAYKTCFPSDMARYQVPLAEAYDAYLAAIQQEK